MPGCTGSPGCFPVETEPALSELGSETSICVLSSPPSCSVCRKMVWDECHQKPRRPTAATGCIYESIHNQPGPGAALHFRFRSSKLATDLVPDPTQKDGVSPREQKASRSCPNKAQNSRGLHRAGCPVYSRLRMLRLSAAKP